MAEKPKKKEEHSLGAKMVAGGLAGGAAAPFVSAAKQTYDTAKAERGAFKGTVGKVLDKVEPGDIIVSGYKGGGPDVYTGKDVAEMMPKAVRKITDKIVPKGVKSRAGGRNLFSLSGALKALDGTRFYHSSISQQKGRNAVITDAGAITGDVNRGRASTQFLDGNDRHLKVLRLRDDVKDAPKVKAEAVRRAKALSDGIGGRAIDYRQLGVNDESKEMVKGILTGKGGNRPDLDRKMTAGGVKVRKSGEVCSTAAGKCYDSDALAPKSKQPKSVKHQGVKVTPGKDPSILTSRDLEASKKFKTVAVTKHAPTMLERGQVAAGRVARGLKRIPRGVAVGAGVVGVAEGIRRLMRKKKQQAQG